jgi:hypothetical protein
MMKKLKLRALEIGAQEILTREQLKNVFGGDLGSGSGSGSTDACAGKASTIYCRDANYVILNGNGNGTAGTGCPSTWYTNTCSSVTGATTATSTCTC